MKRAAILGLGLVLLTALVAVSCQAQFTETLRNKKAYVASQKDTVYVPFKLGLYSRVALDFAARDSVGIRIFSDTRVPGKAWVAKDTTYFVTSDSASAKFEYMLRDNTTEKIPGMDTETRFRLTFADTSVGVTSANFDLILKYAR